jgi:diacylglycerol kinase
MKKIRRFLQSLSFASRGLAKAWKEELNFRWEIIAAILVIGFGLFLRLPASHLALIILTCSVVLALELVNTMIESVSDMLKPRLDQYVKQIKDLSAAAEDMARFTVSQFGVMGTLMMWAIGRPGDPRQQTTAQRVIGSIPGLERILRVSDRGLDEKAWEEVDLKDQESARFKLGLPQNARNATRERYRLQRLRAAAADKPEGKLPKHDEKRLNVLMGWYRDVYLPATRYMHEAQDRSNTPMSEKWRAWLERETDKRLK